MLPLFLEKSFILSDRNFKEGNFIGSARSGRGFKAMQRTASKVRRLFRGFESRLQKSDGIAFVVQPRA